ncbi:MAG: ABC transporter permease [Chloroflexi bacterium]|nr:ABC transporter permease [Chloroflexota bacterium]
MTNYLIRRLFTLIIVLFLSTVAIFYILNAAPGGPLDALRMEQANDRMQTSQQDFERLEALLGLDKPAHMRYIVWLLGDDWIETLPTWFTGLNNEGEAFENGNRRGILRGDWGVSWSVARNRDVLQIIQGRLGNTIILMSAATILSLAVAVPIGVFSAVRQYSTLDYMATTFSFVGISMPVFWLGLIMIILFSLQFDRWGLPSLPSGGVESLRGPMAGTIGDRIIHLLMPTFVLSLLYMAGWSRFMRSSMLDVLNQDYVRTARAKGLIERIVIAKHAFRNALIPLVTIVMFQLSALFGGAVITETVFAYPGMGLLYINALYQSDWPLVQGYLLILATLVVMANLIADIAYVIIDPRIKYE